MIRTSRIALMLALPAIQLSIIKPPPQDLRPAPVDLSNDIDVNEVNESAEVDVSAKRAAEVFGKLHEIMAKGQGELSHYSHYVLNVNNDTDSMNNTLLEHWRIGHDDLGARTYSLIITTTDHMNEEEPIHEQIVKFQCKYEEVVEQMVCIPEKCDLEPLETEPSPGVICAFNYRQSQTYLSSVYESTHSITDDDLGDGVYESTLECLKKKIENITVFGVYQCYYKGFEPNDVVTLEEMNEKLIDEGWKRIEDPKMPWGSKYSRESVVEEKTASAKVDENNQTLTEAS